MKKIVLISCASKKLDHEAKAKDLYVSPLFKFNLRYATSLKPDLIFILSAKYGLVELDRKLEPYNLTLNNMKDIEIKVWATNILSMLEKVADSQADNFVFLAGAKYRKHLIPNLKHYEVPLYGLGIGKQLQFLKNKLK